MKWLRPIISIALTVLLIFALQTRMGQLPALGNFLNPYHGFWQNIQQQEKDLTLTDNQLQQEVTVLWDKRKVPHIFAKNDHDLYFAQGYVTASDRLWQMEFQTRAVAGRLSEVLGKKALEYDEKQRKLGLLYAAKNALKAVMENEKSRSIATAYSAGVNAYIRSLAPADYPLEYKLLGYAPEKWTPLKTTLLLKLMAWDLAGGNHDREMSNLVAKFGYETVEKLFPDMEGNRAPIITPDKPWDFQARFIQSPKKLFLPASGKNFPFDKPSPSNGSNNWAVSGKKTKSGFPLLANDPHLRLRLPSIWYEIQLTTPEMSCYGVSIPGAPAIIIGFNKKVAWGVTNGAIDVADWYKIQFKDDTHQEYWHDEQWKPAHHTLQVIKVRGEKNHIFPLVFTHHGPVAVLKDLHTAFAFRWLAHDPSNELLTFHYLNRAENYQQYTKALEFYNCPAQNFAFASQDGDIAMWHNGLFPLRWKKQGKYLSDGTNPRYDWAGWIPRQHNPHSKNPKRGFVSSANQHPTDQDYPYWLPGKFEKYRNVRINQRLSEMNNIDKDAFLKLQNDNRNLPAESVLPTLLGFLSPETLTADQLRMYQVLQNWDYNNDAKQVAPSCFHSWWRNLYPLIWEDELGGESFRTPSRYHTMKLIREQPNASWFDNVNTPEIETAKELAVNSFLAAYRQLQVLHGSLQQQDGSLNPKWQLGKHRGTDLLHPLNLDCFSRLSLPTSGGKHIVNATRKRNGVSWRMIVSLEKPIKAWGVYPGGQSGNPGSPFYDQFVETWTNGTLYKLQFLNLPQDLADPLSTWRFKGGSK